MTDEREMNNHQQKPLSDFDRAFLQGCGIDASGMMQVEPPARPRPRYDAEFEHVLEVRELLFQAIDLNVVQRGGAHAYFRGRYLGNGDFDATRGIIAMALEADLRLAVKRALRCRKHYRAAHVVARKGKAK